MPGYGMYSPGYVGQRTIANIMEGVVTLPGTRVRKLANNTVSYIASDYSRVIRLHRTDIIRFGPADMETWNSDGWMTSTTRDRFNRFGYGGSSVWTHNGVWYVQPRMLYGYSGPTIDPVIFADGMTFTPAPDRTHYTVQGAGDPQQVAEAQRQVRAYVTALRALPTLPRPNGGDCWLCAFLPYDTVAPGPCVAEHVAEGYIHGTLILDALRFTNAGDHAIYAACDEWDKGAARNSWARAFVTRAVRRYVRRAMGLGS